MKDNQQDYTDLVAKFNDNFAFFSQNYRQSPGKPDLSRVNQEFVVGKFPIVWFGDLPNYLNKKNRALKIVTIGLNPAKDETNENKFSWYPKKAVDHKNANNSAIIKSEIQFYNDYFNNRKQHPSRYFTRLEETLNYAFRDFLDADKEKISFDGPSKMIHIDAFSPIATDPSWSELKKDTNTPTVADKIVFGDTNSRQLFAKRDKVGEPYPQKSNRVLEDELYDLLDPDVTIFIGTQSYFENTLAYNFRNSFSEAVSSSDNLLEEKAKVYISKNSTRPRCLIFKRNALSNFTNKEELYDALHSQKSNLDFLNGRLV